MQKQSKNWPGVQYPLKGIANELKHKTIEILVAEVVLVMFETNSIVKDLDLQIRHQKWIKTTHFVPSFKFKLHCSPAFPCEVLPLRAHPKGC